MIRPTERFEISWEDSFELVSPTKSHENEMAELFHQAFSGGIGQYGTRTLEDHQKSIKNYFEKNSEPEILKRASTLIYHQSELIAACLIGTHNGLASLNFTVVRPDHQGKGLSTRAIQRALTILKDEYDWIKLAVTTGNSAERLYHNMGFIPSVAMSDFGIPANES